jgi:hypothetical protein
MKSKATTLPLAVLLSAGCGGASAPEPTPAQSAPAAPEDQEQACIQPVYAKTSKGVDVRLGDKTISFAYSEKLGETSYNYTRREVFLKGEGELDGAMLDASCYSETDCDAPNDADGNALWCLVSHTNLSGRSLRPLFIGNNLCPPPVEVIEQLVIRTASPSCFRVALATSPGASNLG